MSYDQSNKQKEIQRLHPRYFAKLLFDLLAPEIRLDQNKL